MKNGVLARAYKTRTVQQRMRKLGGWHHSKQSGPLTDYAVSAKKFPTVQVRGLLVPDFAGCVGIRRSVVAQFARHARDDIRHRPLRRASGNKASPCMPHNTSTLKTRPNQLCTP